MASLFLLLCYQVLYRWRCRYRRRHRRCSKCVAPKNNIIFFLLGHLLIRTMHFTFKFVSRKCIARFLRRNICTTILKIHRNIYEEELEKKYGAGFVDVNYTKMHGWALDTFFNKLHEILYAYIR